MGRANITLLVVVTIAVVGMTVVPATAQVQSADRSSSQSQQSSAALEPKDDDDPWLANGTGGKENGGREDNEQQQYPGATTFQIDNHAPGASGNSFNIYAVGFSENIRMHWNVVQQSDFDFSNCNSASARAFGVDRGNDDPNTQTDQSLLDAYQSVSYTQDNIFVEFYKEQQLAGGPVNITVQDQIVSRVANCLQNPQEPGWYRLTGYINGSTKMDAQTDFTIFGASKFTYICEGCDSRQAAIDKLGPPPQTCPEPDEFSQGQKEWMCRTEGGEYYTNSDPPGNSGGTNDSNSQNTPTPTDGQNNQDQNNQDDQNNQNQDNQDQNNQDQNNQDQNNQTETPTETDTPTETGDGTVTGTSTGDGQTATGGDENQQPDGDNQTPTTENGPGFGAVVSLLALLGAGLLAVRPTRRSD